MGQGVCPTHVSIQKLLLLKLCTIVKLKRIGSSFLERLLRTTLYVSDCVLFGLPNVDKRGQLSAGYGWKDLAVSAWAGAGRGDYDLCVSEPLSKMPPRKYLKTDQDGGGQKG